MAEIALESNAALNWANNIARASRWVAYKAKTELGFDGLHIVEEGDSWTQYPLLLEDIVDQLGKRSGQGDLLASAPPATWSRTWRRARNTSPPFSRAAPTFFCSPAAATTFSATAVSPNFCPFEEGKTAENLLDLPRLNAELEKVLASYRSILSDVRRHFPKVRVLGHGYDAALPAERRARWIGKPLAERGISLGIGRKIVELIPDRLPTACRLYRPSSATSISSTCAARSTRAGASWFDELHPQNAGFGRAAEEFRKAIKAIALEIATEAAVQIESAVGDSAGGAGGAAIAAIREGTAGGNLPGLEAASGIVIALDPGHGGAPPPVKLGGSSWNNAIGPSGTLEKTLTLDVAKKTRALLEDRGFEVLLTREGDNNLSLMNRASVAKRRMLPSSCRSISMPPPPTTPRARRHSYIPTIATPLHAFANSCKGRWSRNWALPTATLLIPVGSRRARSV